jgi:NADH:ubiquinone oxidoreductase subunit 2 (subunit N)
MVIFGILFVPTIKTYLAGLKNYDFEFVLVLFFSFFSSILLLNSNDLISLFFIIELQSLSFYIIVASKQTSSFSTEAGLKYFILGSFSSGLMLFGISLIYGFTGLLSFSDLSLFCSEIFNLYYINKLVALSFILGVLMLTVGLVFKFGAAPFHM